MCYKINRQFLLDKIGYNRKYNRAVGSVCELVFQLCVYMCSYKAWFFLRAEVDGLEATGRSVHNQLFVFLYSWPGCRCTLRGALPSVGLGAASQRAWLQGQQA